MRFSAEPDSVLITGRKPAEVGTVDVSVVVVVEVVVSTSVAVDVGAVIVLVVVVEETWVNVVVNVWRDQ